MSLGFRVSGSGILRFPSDTASSFGFMRVPLKGSVRVSIRVP